jgi:hypothetical protein
VNIICTDRGQHRRRRLGELWEDDATGELRAGPWVTRRTRLTHYDSATQPIPHPNASAHPIRYRCDVCRRDVQWAPETARRMYDTLTAAGMHTADVSLL